MVFKGIESNTYGNLNGTQGVGGNQQQQVFSGSKKSLADGISMQVDSRRTTKKDTVTLHDVSVTEVTGPIALDMNGKVHNLVLDAVRCVKAVVPLNHGKKKGKRKRWAREGGIRDLEPEKLVHVELKRVSTVDLGDDNSVLKK